MEQDDRDMLIRIDTKVSAMEEAFKTDPYPKFVQKVKTHGRLFWGVVTLSIAAACKSFFGN